ncbi:MAG: valine--tRNA ligase [Spirochaetaceae bacterium]|jgi:valyl-tRNA synthetase|nr:valine--tRNA ligase [Spirochaetaceae bacterium]
MLKAIELEKAYDPRLFEDSIYQQWKDSGAFQPRGKGESYTIVIPPPNVTGVLHLGHGLNNSLQDIIIRFHRMRGARTLWVPGTDHAGIATQNVVEKKLRARGLNRRDLGREKFIEETWKVKNEHHEIISRQLARIGASVDWSRERFTLDEGLSRAVREVFVTLYERDLLYKGNYLVNWCCSCGTALSDDEVEHQDTPGKMYHIRYPVAGEEGRFIEIATTRPETMLGDCAVAVHPEDGRYADMAGKSLVLPLADREIPLVADPYVDRNFGTGAVKITPAHDPNDWELAKRQDLPVINILNPNGTLNGEVPPAYRNLTVQEARDAVLKDLKDGGFFIKEQEISHAVGHCYRCHTVIEPFLSEQWFVRMKPLAEKALASWKRGELVFYPRRWENTYEHWLSGIRDWCISRQLWWGHRIPAWTCADCGRTFVSRTDLSVCPQCGSVRVEQDPDVLDTWFSSWLWPFTTLGWENPSCNTEDFEAFYPTSALITAYDIIFFWVARMIMAGLEFTGQAPFRDIYIHGLIRDKKGRKMSKSLGNGLDPLELVDEFGADALKFTLAFMCAQGQDILIDKESFKLGSKFANKIWNASRYILMNLEGCSLRANPELASVDRWIYSRLNSAAGYMTDAFLAYRFNDAAQRAYEYFWNDFCDWYVEATKLSMKGGDDAERDRAVTVLLGVLAESLRLLHPLLPFVTEEIYGKLPAECKQDGPAGRSQNKLLINEAYPRYIDGRRDTEGEERFSFLQDLVRQIRTLRSECTITPDKRLRCEVRTAGERGGVKGAFLREHAELVKLLAGLGDLALTTTRSGGVPGETPDRSGGVPEHTGPGNAPDGAIVLAGQDYEAHVYIAGAVNITALAEKFRRSLERDKKYLSSLKAKLSNSDFIKNAPPELVEGERQKLTEAIERTETIEAYLKNMAGTKGQE